ncbi:hypothetical protein FE257_002353 [Aspergillus nanangensis]|uniref:RRM domain-containing protein n=1 Tax=Aspergillus nanangensis TaxID=2582783 RepID=A0AAD4CCQ8_ASPNN|nr:hypothetical protein FE257_002353 [Aspergillus nanangensis]
MLELFQIRDLHRAPSTEPQNDAECLFDLSNHSLNTQTEPQTRRGIIQISRSDYDELATNHPRAQLTYTDDDDGELIMVGSSLELFQRLEDPIPLDSFSVPDFSGPVSTSYPMHIFDIRRSKSVTNLWKKYEYKPEELADQKTTETTETQRTENVPPANSAEGHSPDNQDAEDHTLSTGAEMTPLMAAFEAQMADIMRASEALDRANEESSTPRATEPQTRPNTDRHQGRNEAFTLAIQNLINGADRIRSGVMASLPELERQLQNAQRSLPEPVGSSVNLALTTLEDQARSLASAFHNATGARGQGTGPTLPSELPTGLRNIASDIGHVGQTLFNVFESEFGCASGNQAQAPSGDGPVPSPQRTEHSQVSSAVRADETIQQSGTQHAGPNPTSQTEHGIREPRNGGHQSSSSAPILDIPNSSPTIPRPSDGHSPLNQDVHESSPPQTLAHHLPSPHARNSCIPVIQTCPVPMHPRPRAEEPNIDTRRTWVPHQSNYSPPRSHSTTLFIGNVGFNVNEKMVFDVFASKGFLVDVHLPTFPETGTHAGFGYVFFHAVSEAKAALEVFQGFHIDGHAINLEYSDVPLVERSDMPYPFFEDEDQDSMRSSRSAPLSVADLCSTDSRHPIQRSSTVENSALLDSQRLDALYPSLLPGNAPSQPSSEYIADQERRFPPVSQLDAHFLAAQRAQASMGHTPVEVSGTSVRSRNIPGSFPQDAPDNLEARPWGFSVPHCGGRPTGPYFRPYNFDDRTPLAGGDVPRNPDARQKRIDECISILEDLGYGSAQEGGHQRITVYAEAADGGVIEAIEMIEEERKAYEQQRPTM